MRMRTIDVALSADPNYHDEGVTNRYSRLVKTALFAKCKASGFHLKRILGSNTTFGNWKPFKNNEKRFLFHLKSSFCSQDI